jgi:hypothetical protein
MSTEQFVWSTSEEWFNSEFFDSREDAIEAACGKLGPGEGFFVGIVKHPKKPIQDGQDVAEWICNHFYDQLNEWASEEAGPEASDHSPSLDIAPHTHKAAMEEIAAILTRITPEPTFYTVEKVTKHVVPDLPPATTCSAESTET